MTKVRNATTILGLSMLLGAVVVTGIVTMTDASGTGRVARTPVTSWTASLSAVDAALADGDVSRALASWQPAYVAALDARQWETLIAVGDARLRIERAAGTPKPGDPNARELYLIALSAAKQDGSAKGVLTAAAALDALGDRDSAASAMPIAHRQ